MHSTIAPLILAENYQGLGEILLAVPITLIVLAAASFVPAVLGHWSAPAMAGPAVGLGLLMFLCLAPAHAPGWVMLLAIAPALLGMGSLKVWSVRRPREK